jgi:hypothetical protein
MLWVASKDRWSRVRIWFRVRVRGLKYSGALLGRLLETVRERRREGQIKAIHDGFLDGPIVGRNRLTFGFGDLKGVLWEVFQEMIGELFNDI